MTILKLNDGFTFTAERTGKRMRLIIFNKGIEYVCRKESISRLNLLTEADESHIFKGRLQLHKRSGEISVEAKGETLGVISLSDFKKYLTEQTL